MMHAFFVWCLTITLAMRALFVLCLNLTLAMRALCLEFNCHVIECALFVKCLTLMSSL